MSEIQSVTRYARTEVNLYNKYITTNNELTVIFRHHINPDEYICWVAVAIPC